MVQVLYLLKCGRVSLSSKIIILINSITRGAAIIKIVIVMRSTIGEEAVGMVIVNSKVVVRVVLIIPRSNSTKRAIHLMEMICKVQTLLVQE